MTTPATTPANTPTKKTAGAGAHRFCGILVIAREGSHGLLVAGARCVIAQDSMKLFVKLDSTRGDSAHIPNSNGQPICKVHIKLANWQLAERDLASINICRRCQHIWQRGDLNS